MVQDVVKETVAGARRPALKKAIVIRLTERERDTLNRESQERGVSLNMLCRDRLGLEADLEPREVPRGNPEFVRVRA